MHGASFDWAQRQASCKTTREHEPASDGVRRYEGRRWTVKDKIPMIHVEVVLVTINVRRRCSGVARKNTKTMWRESVEQSAREWD